MLTCILSQSLPHASFSHPLIGKRRCDILLGKVPLSRFGKKLPISPRQRSVDIVIKVAQVVEQVMVSESLDLLLGIRPGE